MWNPECGLGTTVGIITVTEKEKRKYEAGLFFSFPCWTWTTSCMQLGNERNPRFSFWHEQGNLHYNNLWDIAIRIADENAFANSIVQGQNIGRMIKQMKICGLTQKLKKKTELKRNRAGKNGGITNVKSLLKKSNRTLFYSTKVSFSLHFLQPAHSCPAASQELPLPCSEHSCALL